MTKAVAVTRAASAAVQERATSIEFESVRRWVVTRRMLLLKWIGASIVLLYILSGVVLIGPDEAGVVRRFGRKLIPACGPGIHYRLPWPIDQVSRIKPNQIQVVEIGFRTIEGSQSVNSESQVYEWNIQHRTGRYERRPDESLMLTGDENLVEVNAVIQYSVASAEDYLFATTDPGNFIRVASESVIRSLVGGVSLDRVLTGGRLEIEQNAEELIGSSAEAHHTGIRIVAVQLQDVHPSVEVVDAFRSVSTAFEEKNKLINESEGYRNEQVQVSRGNAQAQLAEATSYTAFRTNRAMGDGLRFNQAVEAFGRGPNVTETRLYLETIEQVLAGRKKMIIDSSKFGHRQMLFVDPQGVPLELGKAPNQ
jgi:HflK protein